MNNESSQDNHFFLINVQNKRIFITRKPIVPKNKYEKLIMQIDNHIESTIFLDLARTNPSFKASDCEIVDITNWQYENYEDLCIQINNYKSLQNKTYSKSYRNN